MPRVPARGWGAAGRTARRRRGDYGAGGARSGALRCAGSVRGPRPVLWPRHRQAAAVERSSGRGGWGQLRVLPGCPRSLLDRQGRGPRPQRSGRGRRALGDGQGRARRAWGGVWMPGCRAAAPPLPILSALGSAKPMDAWAPATAAEVIGQRLMKGTPPFYRARRAGAPPSPRQSHDALSPHLARRAPQAPRLPARAWPRRRSS